MCGLHLHIHLDRELVAESKGAIHVHLEAERNTGQEMRSGGGTWGSGFSPVAGHKSMLTSGGIDPSQGSGQQKSPRAEQRIRSKVYRLEFVPPEPCGETQKIEEPALPPDCPKRLMLELASGNQRDPIVWESFEPHSERGAWRLCVFEDFARLIAVVTYVRDPRAIWMLSDWTPRGSLILEPVERQRYARLMLTPVLAFQR